MLATLDAEIVGEVIASLSRGGKVVRTFDVGNTQRSIGARLSSAIVRKWGPTGLAPDSITLRLRGSCGQSLGAFGAQGLRIEVEGDANDYVGKGLSGATIVLKPPRAARFAATDNTIVGNTVLYGATSGFLFAAGQAGERFAVRNSGAVSVVEGCGANGCEYMTGGVAVILGTPGDNFAAGMTGGVAFVCGSDEALSERVNLDSVVRQPVARPDELELLRKIIRRHLEETQSLRAEKLLGDWGGQSERFWRIAPLNASDSLPLVAVTRPEEAYA